MTRKMLILAVGLFLTLAVHAKKAQPDAALYDRYVRLFHTVDPDSSEVFYGLSAQLQQFHLRRGQLEEYYNIRRIEIRYEADRAEYLKAIKKANTILADMKGDKEAEKYSDIIYCSLGTTYIRQGNHEMAIRYFREALKYVTPADSTRFVHAYAGLAHAYITHHPEKAWQLNERLGELIKMDSTYLKVYLAHKVQICFYRDDKENFLKAVKEYEALIKNPASPQYKYGENTIGIMENAMTDRHNEVLRTMDTLSSDVSRIDTRMRIYEKMGRQDLALKEAYRRMEIQDSFNNDLINENLNELNEALGITKLQEKAAKERELWMTVVIVLLVIAIALLVSRYLIRRRYQKQVMRQNEQLAIALDEAKESERMKANFVQHVSHEMRTPLNIINGYTQIIADPKYDLPQEDRETMLQAIEQNTAAMTATINDLLEISHETSKERYPRTNQIVVNDFCRSSMAYAEQKNNGRLKLGFHSSLPDDFTILSNHDGIERILRQLLKNALKFTEKGKVELSVYESTDGTSVHFAVTDTGVGIPEEYHTQVFEQFYKVDSFKQGLGVGLPMSRKVAIRLGGTLNIDKDYHGGTRMILTIPKGT